MYKTNDKDFKIFEKEVRKWQKRFGLTDWDLKIYHEEFLIENALAMCECEHLSRAAKITLNIKWSIPPIKKDIKRYAFHEVCELLLARINDLAYDRFVCADNIEEEKHTIIRRMENGIWDKNQQETD
jgi:hypothetical protein